MLPDYLKNELGLKNLNNFLSISGPCVVESRSIRGVAVEIQGRQLVAVSKLVASQFSDATTHHGAQQVGARTESPIAQCGHPVRNGDGP